MAATSRQMVGREDEIALLEGLLRHARAGTSVGLVVRGEPGIGKTSLLEDVVGRALEFRVLRAFGVESESDLAFAGLLELLRPVLDRLTSLPEGQARALSAALAVSGEAGADRFAVYVATLTLLASVAEERPLVCVIDDAQWLDRSSAEALVFATRRFAADRVAMLFGARESEETRFEARGVPELLLGGLPFEHARTLLRRATRDRVAAEVEAQLIRRTDGNPLALIEIPAVLSARQRIGTEPLDDPLRGGVAVQRAFGARASRLSLPAQRALLVAAVSGSDELTPIIRACGPNAAALDEAQSAGLIRVDGERVRFRHPLVRSAVYERAAAGERRSAHAALSIVLAKTDAERAVWHRALATIGEDEDVAAGLAQAAETARRRGGADSQARLLERAARLTPDPGRRAGRLHDAGRAAYHAGRIDYAAALLDEGLETATDPLLRADLVEGRTEVARAAGDIESWVGRCRAEAERVEVHDRVRASNLLFQVWEYLGEQLSVDAAREALEQATSLAGASVEQSHVLAAQAGQLMMEGRTAEARKAALRGAELSLEHPTERAADFGYFLGFLGEYEAARALIEHITSHFRRHGMILDLAKATAALSFLEVPLGRFAEARVAAQEAVTLSEEAGIVYRVCDALSALAIAEATLGADADCRAHAELAGELGLSVGLIWTYTASRFALGRLELGGGRTEQAIATLEPLRDAHCDLRSPGYTLWQPDLIEAYARGGRVTDARELLDLFERDACSTEHEWSLVALARCRALLAGEDCDRAFVHALGVCGEDRWPFERGRAELLYGERLRRAGRRAESRAHLRSAFAAFEQLGAVGFAERARRELRASGETMRRRDPSLANELTAQELQIVMLVARGSTNREVAASVFLSPKTVEKHLSSAYRKLGVRSRTELAYRFAQR